MSIKQAGNGPSRRHIQGSKIAKRLQSVKYFFYSTRMRKKMKNLFEFFLKSPVSRIVPKNVKGAAFGSF